MATRSDNKIGIAQAGSTVPEELSEVESVIEDDADPSYSEDFAEGTNTGTFDRSFSRQSAGASPLASPRSRMSEKDASYSEDFAEATLEATLEEPLPSASVQRPSLDRRQEIALRQQADAQKTVIVPTVSDEDDIEEEDIPDGGDFSDEDFENSGSMYDPEARRREEEEEMLRREEEERQQREREEAEQVRKQREIEEANRRLAAERKRKLEEEEKKRAEQEAYRKKQEEERRREEAKRVEEEKERTAAEAARKREEEAARKSQEEERRKAEEEVRKREDEERRKAEEEAARKREEDQRRKATEEAREREEERRKAEEEARKREEEHRKAEEEARRREEELAKKEEEHCRQAEEELSRKREEEVKARAEEERRVAEAAEAQKREELRSKEQMLQIEDEVAKQKEQGRLLAALEQEEERKRAYEEKQKRVEEGQAPAPQLFEANAPQSPEHPTASFAARVNAPASPEQARPGRRFSGAWIHTELEPASAPPVPNGDHGAGSTEESFGGNGRSRSCFESESSERFRSAQHRASEAWSSPKHGKWQWDSERRTASTTVEDGRSHQTRWSSSWEQDSGRTGAWDEWRDGWRGNWWQDWGESREKDLRLPFEARGEDPWSQRCSRQEWRDTLYQDQHWDRKIHSRQAEKENLWSQLQNREWEQRSPSHSSGLWQPPRSHAALEGRAAPYGSPIARPFDMQATQFPAAGLYGHATPFGVLYPWGFHGYPVPTMGPSVGPAQPMVDSVTLSPTGSRPGASPTAPVGAEPQQATTGLLQLRPHPRSSLPTDDVKRPLVTSGGAPEDLPPEPREQAPTVGAEVLESTLVVSSPDLDFQESLVSTLVAVVDEMLQFKYGCSIDTADYRGKLLALCDATALCSLPRLVDYANSRTELWAVDARCGQVQLQLRLACQELPSFGDLCQRLRLLPGMASAVAVISARGGYAVQALAAFRTSCSDTRFAVGRCHTPGSRALEHFSTEEFCSAVALEPSILSLQAPVGSPYQELPELTEEFRNLRQLLEGRGEPVQRKPRLSPGLLAALHARAPSALAFRHVAAALESTDVEMDVVIELFRRLVEWFRNKSPSNVAAAQNALAEAPAHVALVACLRRCLTSRELCDLGCQLIARAARQHVENAAAFVGAGAAKLICQILQRYFGFKDVQRYGLQAITILAHYGGGSSQAIAADVLRLALRALSAHRESASVQISGCEVLRCLGELGEAPLEELAEAAQLAKRAFATDTAVHRAADALLSFTIPRSAGAIGALMDSATADETAQRNAICSLGHLAGYGGVAWRGASRVALNRILRAMAQHKGSAVLVATGLWALGRFVERVDAPPGGLQDAARQAKTLHADSALVCRHADELIAYLMRVQ